MGKWLPSTATLVAPADKKDENNNIASTIVDMSVHVKRVRYNSSHVCSIPFERSPSIHPHSNRIVFTFRLQMEKLNIRSHLTKIWHANIRCEIKKTEREGEGEKERKNSEIYPPKTILKKISIPISTAGR